jgi:ribosome-associated protein
MARRPFHVVEETGRLAEEVLPSSRPVRGEHRDEMEALKALANRIARLPPGQRRALPLDAETLDQFELLAGAALKPDRRRSLMRAKLLLAHADLDAIQAVLDGRGPDALAAQAADAWRQRLLAGDDTTLQAFLAAHPSGDRQGIRAAIREARGEGAAGKRAALRLLALLRSALGPAVGTSGPEDGA